MNLHTCPEMRRAAHAPGLLGPHECLAGEVAQAMVRVLVLLNQRARALRRKRRAERKTAVGTEVAP